MAGDLGRIKAIFLAALEKSDRREREVFLREACGDDTALRQRVEALLRRHEQPSGILERPVVTPAGEFAIGPNRHDAPASPRVAVGTRLGLYQLLGKIGEGGMGTVWLAEQRKPVQRLVALKVIRIEVAGGLTVARFEAERQAMALMDHPNIAKVLDGGTTDDGRPYFVMELVKGTQITDYCDERRLTPRQRLELFVPVCHALQHAHQKGIIHRDVKPSNVLVALYDGRPVVKVIDFGVAKTAGPRLTERTLFTEFGMVVGTLEYMSPEQAELGNHDIDTRSDVYSLGVLLYELLTGTTPLTAERLKQSSFLDLLQAIREEEPPRPSTRVSDSRESLPAISSRQQTDPTHLHRLLRGELDWIVMKSLEKDRSRRYESASALARDVERYLNDEPVEACPPRAGYRMSKFLRRYRGRVAAAGSVLAALVLGLFGTLIFAAGEAEQRGRAERNARVAEEKTAAALRQAYRAHVAAACAAIQNHDVTDASRQLDEAPETLRGWEWEHLYSRLDDSVAAISINVNEAVQLARGPAGPRVVAHSDTRVRLLDLGGRELLTHSLRPGRNWGLFDLVTPSGPRMLEEVGETLELLDTEGRVLRRMTGVSKMNGGIGCISADGTRLAVVWNNSFSADAPGRRQIAVYEPSKGGDALARVDPMSDTWALSLSADGTRLAAGGEDGLVRIWDGRSGTLTASCRGHESKVLSVAFRPDGRRLLTASADGSVRQWDPETGREAASPFERHTGEVMSAAYSPDGKWVASGGTDRTVRVWNAMDRREVAVLHGHTSFVRDVAFTSGGDQVVSVGAAFFKWNSATGDGTVRLWEASPGTGLPAMQGHTSYVYPVAYSPDGRWIASGSWDQTVRLWDARTGEPCAVLRHSGIVRALAFGADGSLLVSACDGADRLQVWDVATGRPLQELKGPGKTVVAVTLNPDGSHAAALDLDGTIRVIERTSGREIASWRVDGSWAEKKTLAYSPDGRWLAGTGENNRNIEVWDARTYLRTARLKGHTGAVNCVVFSSDGRRLISAGSDRDVRVWDLDTEKCTAVLEGHTDEVFAAALHPGGARLATAGRDRAIWLWDLATGQEVAQLQGHANYVFSLAFSPDGKSLVSGSGDGTVRLWDTEPLKTRYQARREAEALRPEAERLVERLFQKTGDGSAVATVLRDDRTLAEPRRHAAFRAIQRRMAR